MENEAPNIRESSEDITNALYSLGVDIVLNMLIAKEEGWLILNTEKYTREIH